MLNKMKQILYPKELAKEICELRQTFTTSKVVGKKSYFFKIIMTSVSAFSLYPCFFCIT